MTVRDGPRYDPQYLTAAETAKLIRVELRKHFPRTRFSVRTDRGRGVSVRWLDGPTEARVREVVSPFEGKGFDGSIDLQYSIDAWVLNGEVVGTRSHGTEGSRGCVPAWGLIPPHDDCERVHFACWVFTNRDISPALANRCIEQVAAYWGGVARPLPVAVPNRYGGRGFEVADGRGNERVRPDLSHLDDWYSMIHRAAADRSRFAREPAELADPDRRAH